MYLDAYLIFFICANLIYIFTLKKKNISIQDVFPYVFLAFIDLYTLSVYVSHVTKIYMKYPIQQLADYSIIEEVLFTASLAIITFAFCILKYKRIHESMIYVNIPHEVIFKLMYVILFPIAFYLNSIDNWTYGTRTGILSQLSAYARNLLTVLSVVLFCSKKITTIKKIIFLLLFMLLTFKSTQRTNMLIVLIAFVYNLGSSFLVFNYFIAGIFTLLSLGAIRNAISALNVMYPIFAEGLFGSWGLLQSIEAIQKKGYEYTNILKIFNPTINWILSKMNIDATLPTLEQFIVKSTGQTYYPMGGFVYLSDAYLMHPFIGPIIYTILIYFMYRWSLKRYYKSHSPVYLLCLSILFVSVKGALWVFIALLLFHLFAYWGFKWLSNPSSKIRLHI